MFVRLIGTVLLFTSGAVCAGDTALEWLDRSHQAAGGEAWDEVSSIRIHGHSAHDNNSFNFLLKQLTVISYHFPSIS